jgi:RNA polymerase sigma-70 factor (ECF subfamily)
MASYDLMDPGELVHACLQGQDVAWQEFIRRYDRLICGVTLRAAHHWGERSEEIAGDLVQEVYAKLCENQCRLLQGFESRHPGSIFGYLRAIAASVAHDYFRRLHSEKRGSGMVQHLEEREVEIPPTTQGSSVTIERNLLFAQIDGLLQAQLPPEIQERDRMIFWFRHRQGLTAQEIASLPLIGLTAKGVESTLRRLEQMVRTAMMEEGQSAQDT